MAKLQFKCMILTIATRADCGNVTSHIETCSPLLMTLGATLDGPFCPPLFDFYTGRNLRGCLHCWGWIKRARFKSFMLIFRSRTPLHVGHVERLIMASFTVRVCSLWAQSGVLNITCKLCYCTCSHLKTTLFFSLLWPTCKINSWPNLHEFKINSYELRYFCRPEQLQQICSSYALSIWDFYATKNWQIGHFLRRGGKRLRFACACVHIFQFSAADFAFFRSQKRVMNNLKLSLVHEQFLHSDDDELVNLFSINRSSVWGFLHELWAWEIQVLQTPCILLPLTIKRIKTNDEEGK